MFCRPFLIVTLTLWSAGTLLLSGTARAEVTLTRATVQSLRNQVQLRLRNQQIRPARPADQMAPGDALATGQRSLAELRFNDASLARIGERALFQFMPNTRTFNLRNGTVLLLIPPGRGSTRVRTPNATAGIRGSALFVRHIDETNVTLVGALTNSDIEISNEGETQQASQRQVLKAGQMAVVVQNRIERVYNFDLNRFYETSDLVRDLDLPGRAPQQSSTDPAIEAVRQETAQAIQEQAPLTGQVVENPSFMTMGSVKPQASDVFSPVTPTPGLGTGSETPTNPVNGASGAIRAVIDARPPVDTATGQTPPSPGENPSQGANKPPGSAPAPLPPGPTPPDDSGTITPPPGPGASPQIPGDGGLTPPGPGASPQIPGDGGVTGPQIPGGSGTITPPTPDQSYNPNTPTPPPAGSPTIPPSGGTGPIAGPPSTHIPGATPPPIVAQPPTSSAPSPIVPTPSQTITRPAQTIASPSLPQTPTQIAAPPVQAIVAPPASRPVEVVVQSSIPVVLPSVPATPSVTPPVQTVVTPVIPRSEAAKPASTVVTPAVPAASPTVTAPSTSTTVTTPAVVTPTPLTPTVPATSTTVTTPAVVTPTPVAPIVPASPTTVNTPAVVTPTPLTPTVPATPVTPTRPEVAIPSASPTITAPTTLTTPVQPTPATVTTTVDAPAVQSVPAAAGAAAEALKQTPAAPLLTPGTK